MSARIVSLNTEAARDGVATSFVTSILRTVTLCLMAMSDIERVSANKVFGSDIIKFKFTVSLLVVSSLWFDH